MSQKGDQYLEELVVVELANEDKDKLSNLIKYDEELRMMEYWLINPRINEDDCLILGCNIGEENKEGQGIELSCKDMILLQKSSTRYCNGMPNSIDSEEQQQFQNNKIQVYLPKDILDMDIEELRMLMVKVS